MSSFKFILNPTNWFKVQLLVLNPNPTAFMHICLKELSQSEDAIVTQLTNQKLGTLPLSPGSTPTLFLITGIPAVP